MSDHAMTYAIGDVHGEITLLTRLLSVMPLREEDTLVFLGDCLDRGEDSVATILALQHLKRPMRAACSCAATIKMPGFRAGTARVLPARVPDIEGALEVWDNCDGQLPFAVGDWLEETRVEYEDAHGYYVHAGAFPDRPLWRSSDFIKMWGMEASWKVRMTGRS